MAEPNRRALRRALGRASDLVTHDALPNVFHQVVHEVEIVFRCQGREKRLVLLDQVMKVGPSVWDSLKLGVDGTKIVNILEVFYPYDTLASEKVAVSRDPSRIARIERVNPEWHASFNRLLVGNAQEMVRLVGRDMWQEPLKELYHLSPVLPETATDRKSIERKRREIIN